MNNNVVRVFDVEPWLPLLEEVKDHFTFTSSGRLPWLQKICFAVLRRLNCTSVKLTPTVRVTEIHRNKVLEAIMAQHDALVCRLLFNGGCQIYMGPSEWCDVRADTMPFTIYVPVHARDRGDRRVFDMPVTVVPWMKGILVVPNNVSTK